MSAESVYCKGGYRDERATSWMAPHSIFYDQKWSSHTANAGFEELAV